MGDLSKGPSDTSELDDLDLGIIRELEGDGRRGIVDLASALGVHRNVVSARLKRLLRERIVVPGVYAYPPALGYRTVVWIGLRVAPGFLEAVADRMASLPNIHLAFVCLGRYDVLVWGLFRDQEELYAFIKRELGETPGITDTETMIGLGVQKMSFAFLSSPQVSDNHDDGLQDANSPSETGPGGGTGLDEQDLAIIRELQGDARQSLVSLSKAVGVHRNVTSAKLKRLTDRGIVKAVAVPNPIALGYRVMVIVCVSVLPGCIEAASEGLQSLANVHTVTICTGRYDIMLWGFFRDQDELYAHIATDLGKTPGITGTETIVILRVKKMSFAYLTSS